MPQYTKNGWSWPTKQELLDRIGGDLAGSLAPLYAANYNRHVMAVLEGIASVLTVVLAAGWYELYRFQAYCAEQIHPTSASRYGLIEIGKLCDCFVKPAHSAAGHITGTGVDGTYIKAGRKFKRLSDNSIYVCTLATAIDGGVVDIAIESEDTGSIYNCVAGEEFAPLTAIAGLNNALVVDSNGIYGGLDEEDTEDFRERVLYAWRNPPVGAALSDWTRWVTAVTTVWRAWILPCTPEAGHVSAYILAAGDDPIPATDGAAYRVKLNAVEADGSAIYLDKTLFSTRLGRAPAEHWGANGKVIFWGSRGASDPKEHNINELGLVDNGDGRWKITFDGSALTTAPDTWEAVVVLGPICADVWDYVHAPDTVYGESSRCPADCEFHVNTLKAMPITLEIQIPAGSPEELAENIRGELASMLLNEANPGGTLTNWQIHNAIAQAPGHTSHLLIDVNGGGPNGEIEIAADEFPIFEDAEADITITEAT